METKSYESRIYDWADDMSLSWMMSQKSTDNMVIFQCSKVSKKLCDAFINIHSFNDLSEFI